MKGQFTFQEEEAAPEICQQMRENPLVNNFGFRYIPKVDGGGADTCGPILYPQENLPERLWRGRAEVRVFPPDAWYKNPSMFAILYGLR